MTDFRLFPPKIYALPEEALKQCVDFGYKPMTGAKLALERAVDNKEGSLIWRFSTYTLTAVMTGQYKGKPTLVIKHGGEDNPFSSYESYARLRTNGCERNQFILNDNNLWERSCEEGLELRGNKRDIWVVQGKALDRFVTDLVNISEAPSNTVLGLMLGDLGLMDLYLVGQKNNRSNKIRILFDKEGTRSKDPLISPLIFGYNGIDIMGGGYDSMGHIVGMKDKDAFKPKKNSPLDMLLTHQSDSPVFKSQQVSLF